MEQVMRQHLDKQPPAPGTFNPAIPPALDMVILKALRKSPADRFASISAFANAFKQAILFRASASPLVPENAPFTKPSEATPVSGLAPTVYAEPMTPPPIPPTVAASSTPLPARGIPLPVPTESDPRARRELVLPAAPASPIPPKPEIQSKGRSRAQKTFITLGILVILIISGVISVAAIHQNQVNMEAQATATADAAATATVIANNPCPSYIQQCGSLSLALLDPLQSSNYFSPGSNTSFGGNCQYVNNALQVSQSSPDKFFQCTEWQTFSNFVFEVQMTSLQGDCGGMMIRYDSQTGKGYLLQVCLSGNTNSGFGSITKYTSNNGADATVLTSGPISSISGSGTNTLAVAVNNGSITFYVNQQVVATANDSSFSSGIITLVANDATNPTTATYSNARVWA